MRGVTLEEISAATKISVRFLQSIENEEFSRLPGGIFSRSFVRAYARYLGLEEDPLLEEYQLAAKSRNEVDLTQFSPPRTYSLQERRSHPVIWAVIVAVVLLVSGIALWKHSNRPLHVPSHVAGEAAASISLTTRPASQDIPTAAAPKLSKPGIPTQSTAKSKRADTIPGVLAATSPAAPPAPKLPAITNYDGKLVLQIAATERSWVAVDADGKMLMQGIMNPNEVKTFTADNSYDILTGNAQGVILTLNGQTLKSLGRRGEVKQVHLTWDSLKKQTSH